MSDEITKITPLAVVPPEKQFGRWTTQLKEELLGPGPWIDEPDQVEWMAHGLPCVLFRNRFGVWVGYVGISPGHPWHGAAYKADALSEISVHGGVTFAGHWHYVPNTLTTNSDTWWVGFDCGHGGRDVVPAMDRGRFSGYGSEKYRNVEYAVTHATVLASQASQATHALPEGSDAESHD